MLNNQLIIFKATTAVTNQNLLSNDLKGDMWIYPSVCIPLSGAIRIALKHGCALVLSS